MKPPNKSELLARVAELEKERDECHAALSAANQITAAYKTFFFTVVKLADERKPGFAEEIRLKMSAAAPEGTP